MDHIKKENYAQQFFVYLVKFVALGFLSVAFGVIMSQLIDKKFPDQLRTVPYSAEQGIQEAIKFGIAAILIAAPIFLLLSRLVSKWISAGKITLESKVRRWLTYIVLSVVSVMAVSNLVQLIASYLNGDLVMQSFLKIVTILLICAAIFSYYLWEIRLVKYDNRARLVDKTSFWSLAAAILIFLGLGFVNADSPAVSRQKKADDQVVQAIMNLQVQIGNYYQDNKNLPGELTQLGDRRSKYFSELYATLKDDISYARTGDKEYQICGIFNFSNAGKLSGDYNIRWEHGTGKYCYDFEIRLDDKGNVISDDFAKQAIEATMP